MTGPLVLIEPYANRLGGHHQRTLVALAQARPGSLAIAPHGIAHETVTALREAEALHGVAALLGGQPHLRFVHEQVTAEDAAVRLLGRLGRRGEKHVIAVYPTRAVGDQMAAAFPDLPAVVRAFAVDDGRRLTDAE